MASGGTVLLPRPSGNHFCATAAAASARAGEGFMSVTSPAAPTTSLWAAPFNTPPTAWARLLPVRLDSHQASAPAESNFAQPSTKAGLRRLRVVGSAAASHSAAALRSRPAQFFKVALASNELNWSRWLVANSNARAG